MAILASDGSVADVQAKMNLATAGDIVTLPAGTFEWTSSVTWTAPANVTLKGAGTSATGGGDQTIITDDYAVNAPLLDIVVNAAGTFRMTGITIQDGAGAHKDGGTTKFSGPGNVRVDHCHLIATAAVGHKVIVFGAGIRGVLDSSILDFTGLSALYFYNGRSGVGEAEGNYEWTQPTAFGTSDYFFIEDNIINGTVSSGSYSTRVWDGFSAAKVVVRFNDVSQATLTETHDTGHSGDDRGSRSQEVYGNSVTSALAFGENFVGVAVGGGTALAWGNSWDQVYKHLFQFNVTRKSDATYTQTATPGGWGYAGTAFNGTGSNWDGGTYNATDTTLGYPCLDQPGRGAGDLLSTYHPDKINVTTGTIAWPNQALEPIYIWANVGTFVTGSGGSFIGDASGGRVVSDRDYYTQASGIQTSASSPFDGTTGTGWGTLANRPTTCTPGVAYFATDQGTWNRSVSNPYGVQMNGACGKLYRCVTTDVWEEYYEPYTYPHPLRIISEVPPEQNLPPVISPPGGTYEGPVTVTISIIE